MFVFIPLYPFMLSRYFRSTGDTTVLPFVGQLLHSVCAPALNFYVFCSRTFTGKLGSFVPMRRRFSAKRWLLLQLQLPIWRERVAKTYCSSVLPSFVIPPGRAHVEQHACARLLSIIRRVYCSQ